MNKTIDINAARRWFAEDIREAAPVVNNVAIVESFAAIPRENYLGEGPWEIHSRLRVGDVHRSKSNSAHHLYHDVLVSIDEDSGINNGLPSLWARVFDSLNLKSGNTVIQVGAGVGYYTAILAELVSSQGQIIAFEVERKLAERARRNLAHYENVDVVCGDATQTEIMPNIDALVVCAGATHVPIHWLDSLKNDGQMVIPITAADQWGFLMHLTKNGGEFPVKSLGPCGFYHCQGARENVEAEAISKALNDSTGTTLNIQKYCVGRPENSSIQAWAVGQNYWISKG